MKLTYTNVNGYLIPNLTYKSGEQMEQPVSYTHLDVYKRQMHIFMKSITMMYPVIQIHMRVSMISLRSVIHLLLSVLPADLQKQEI